ncbi:uncharacterized protein FIESC28_09833 [Fusarium coffeatum]|uniref:Uncharacterized protein n=1 Tax=Fusarium coffeatum TaxID=231269 RepID=A0A366QXP2_9HYPO|nr:uncharacterized protein FIESC28_09833 [Fusarium coffeatum]RBR09502.1 hypothetical protein FIESC28_09833 [Fusarium coffeatum]
MAEFTEDEPSQNAPNVEQTDPSLDHDNMATSCLRVMSEYLKPNICGLSSPGIDRSTIPKDKISSCISKTLVYACTNWVAHLQTSDTAESLLESKAEYQQLYLENVLELLYRNMSIIDSNPLQIYSSVLIFAPSSNFVADAFMWAVPNWITLRPERVPKDESQQIFEGHQGPVNAAVFSPDASLIASTSDDCSVKIWRVIDGKCLHTLTGHSDAVFSAVFFTDGGTVVSASLDKTIKFWSAKTGKCTRTLRGHNSAVHEVAISPNSTLLTFCSWIELELEAGSGKIWIWSVTERKYLHEWQGSWGGVNSVAFSSDSTLLTSGTEDGVVRVWRVENGECIHTLKGHEEPVQSVVFAPDLSYLASSSTDGTVRVWDYENEECLHEFDCQAWDTKISISSDSKFISSASSMNHIQVWNVKEASCEYELVGHDSDVNSITFSPDSKLLVSTSNDFTIRIWSLSSQSANLSANSVSDNKPSRLQAVVLSPDQSILASSGLAGSIKLWNFQKGGMTRALRLAGYDLLHADEFEFSPDGNFLLVLGYSSGSVAWIWSVHDGRCVHDFTEQEWTASTAVFSRDSKTIIIGCGDYVVRRWSINNGCMDELSGHESALCVVAVSPVGDLLASGDYDGIVRLWNTSTSDGISLHELKGPGGPISEAVFSPNGQLLAVSHEGNTIRIWDTVVGTCLKSLASTDEIGSVALSRDNLLASTGTKNNDVHLWSIEDGTCLQSRSFPRVGSCEIEFDLSGSQIIFDAGQLSIQAPDGEDSVPQLVDSGFALSKGSRWVTWRGEKVLWLPSSVHPTCWLIRGSTVAIGCNSGRVVVLKFDDMRLQDRYPTSSGARLKAFV